MILDGPYQGFIGTRKVDDRPSKPPDGTVTVFHAQGDINDLVIVGYDQDRRTMGWILGAVTIAVAIGFWVTHRRAIRHGQRQDPRGQPA